MLNRRGLLKAGVGLGAMAAFGVTAAPVFAEGETIKVGVLHSLSGTMAISETTLK
ncbi:MAG: transporter substrate-binding protein, partial [Alphaproteobacteria bacterium]|nr:transporter substrate-binding protein [Alphaproteobacteria bacterium]